MPGHGTFSKLGSRWAVFLCGLCYCGILFGQGQELVPVTKTLYLSNATVVTAPGEIHKNTSILIDAGRIQTVGGRTPIPTHARVLGCDSLFVYAGFFEGISYTGTEPPKDERRGGGARPPEAQVEAGNPPNEQAGITPEKSVREALKPSEKSISEMRALGFTMAHVVPRGRMLPGTGAIVMLRDGNLDQLIFKEDVSLFARFSGASQMYPATVIGVMAKWRQLYRQAEFAMTHQKAFEQGAAIGRPVYDQAIYGMIPVINKQMSVFFEASSSTSISRAFALREELGFDLVLAETKRADEWSTMISAKAIPTLISLDLPEDKSSADTSADKSDAPGTTRKDTSAKDTIVHVDPEMKLLEARRQKSLEDHYRQASVLAAAGVPFGFSTLSVKPKDIFPHLRKMIEFGLTEDQALAALTVNPAKLLHLESLCGTIAPGKLANVVVTTGPLFDEKTQIRYVIVDGQLFEYDLKPPKNKKKTDSADAVVTPVGKWRYRVDIPGDRTYTGVMVLTGNDDALSGYFISDDDGAQRGLSNITFDGSRLRFTSEVEGDGGMIPLHFDVRIQSADFTGDVAIGDLGVYIIDADRVPE